VAENLCYVKDMFRLACLVALFLALCAASASGQTSENRQCLVADSQTASEMALWISQSPCTSSCKGCGCTGGPGYRDYRTRKCVGWADLNKKCGPPPHRDCEAECVPAKEVCQIPQALFAILDTRPADLPTNDDGNASED